MNRRAHAVALALLLAGCAPATRPPQRLPSDAGVQEQLMAADRDFARAVLDSGWDAWVRRLAPDVAKPGGRGEVIVRGRDPVGAQDKATLFRDPAVQLRWEPTDAVGYTDGRTGMTVGRAATVRRGTTDTLYRGHYVTIWQRQPNGKWLIILDTGTPDP